ncbi:MAG: MBL fold metallo-hydrolase [Longimicrobiales bacterium]
MNPIGLVESIGRASLTALPAIAVLATQVLVAASMILPGIVSAQDFADVEIRTTRITESIYMLRGAGGNIGLSIGDDGAFLVDDQYAPLTDRIQEAISELTDEDVEFVINTHWHYDHSDGNENFGRAGALIIAHENSRRRMMTDQYVTVGDRRQEAYELEGLPKISFQQTMSMHLNGEDVDIFHVSNAHTNGDAIVYFRGSDVIHAGDVFVRYGIPFIDKPNGGSIQGMIAAIYRIAGLIGDDTVVIPGHGDLSTRTDLLEYGQMLTTIRDRIQEGIDAGDSLDDIIASEPLRGFPEPNVGTERFIRWTYETLTEGPVSWEGSAVTDGR